MEAKKKACYMGPQCPHREERTPNILLPVPDSYRTL